MSTVRLTLLVEGNEHGYYVDAREMGENVREWIDTALGDRDDISAWSVQITTDEDADR